MARHGRTQQLSLFLLLVGVGHVLCQLEYIETGKSYTFKPSVTVAFDSVLWKFNNDKVVEYEDGNVKWFQFKDQGHFDEKTGVLTLNGLKSIQSGHYESESLVSGELQTKKYDIQVIDAVPKPKVECIKDNETVTSLECFLEPEVDGVTFTWTGPGDKKNTGKTLQITEEMRKDNSALFFCTAKNRVSEMETEFFLRTCVPEPVVNIGAIVGGVVGALGLVGIGIVAVYFWRKLTGDDEEVRTGIPMQKNTSNSNNCTKDGKDLEGSNNIGHGNTEKVNAEQEDLDDSQSEKPKTDLPNTVNIVDERAEEDQAMPESAERGHGDTPTPQETPDEDKNSMDESNGGTVKIKNADPSRDEKPEPILDNGTSNEESGEGQNQTEDTPLIVHSSPDADPPRDEEREPVIGNDTNNEESAEGQNQTEDTPLIVHSSPAASGISRTIAKFENLQWKPKELTTRDAGQKNSAT